MTGRRGVSAVFVTSIALMLLGCVSGVIAREPYPGYIYNVWGESVPTPNGYLPERVVNGLDLGVGELRQPQDLFVDHRNHIFILDSGNNRIIVLGETLEVIRILDRFTLDGTEEKLGEPEGIFVSREGSIFVADTENHRVVAMDSDGRIFGVYTRPESDIFPADLEYLPIRVLVDRSNVVYVVARGLYYGAVMHDITGRFLGFYGSNKVDATARVLADFFWKQIMSQEQRERMARFVPVEYTSFDIDSEDFIYTCTAVSRTSRDEIKKLNPMGSNIYARQTLAPGDPRVITNFGDLENAWYKGEYIDTRFTDIVVDSYGFIVALDQRRGRLFQYDQEAHLLFVFGGKGHQVGTFQAPAAVEVFRDQIVVLDGTKANLTFFSRTSFAETVHEAVIMYNEGLYQDAVGPWEDVLNRCINYELGYIGIGNANVKTEDYVKAMKNFNLGFDKSGYSEAFEEYRTFVVRHNFSIIVSVLAAFIISVSLFGRWRKTGSVIKRRKGRYETG